MSEVVQVPAGTAVAFWQALGAKREGNAWLVPERDAAGEVIGWAVRRDAGGKSCKPGSKRGLTFVPPLPSNAGTSADEPVYVVEGGSDTAAGLGLGLNMVGRPSATGGLSLLVELLRGRHVCIIGENDRGAGRDGAERIAKGLRDRCASVRVIFPPAPHKDLRQWVADGVAVRSDVEEAAAKAKPLQVAAAECAPPLATVCMADVKPERIDWLWPGRVPRGMLSIAMGEPEAGKSLITVDLAARVSTGRPWPFETEGREPAGVLLCCPEDSAAHTVVPRLRAAGADLGRVWALDDQTFDLTDTGRLEAYIAERGIALVIMDPITAYLPAKSDGNDEGSVRGLLHPLVAVAERTRAAVVAIKHTRKAAADSPLKRMLGAVAWGAMARAVWAAAPMPEDADTRVFCKVKMNIARDPGSLVYTIGERDVGDGILAPFVEWVRHDSVVGARDVFPPAGGDGEAPAGGKAREKAREFLLATLGAGPVPQSQVVESAERVGIAEKTLKRAKGDLGVESFLDGGVGSPFYWRLPGERAKPVDPFV